MEGCKLYRLDFCRTRGVKKVRVSRRAEGPAVSVSKGEVKQGLSGGGIPLWKMYWSSWKNRSKKREEQENLRVRGSAALACG